MPLFEFRCESCGHKFSDLVGMTADSAPSPCPKCGSAQAKKLVSRFVRGRSEDARIDEMADRMELMGEPESPSEVRKMVREMGKALDDDAADEMEEMFESDAAGGFDDE